MKTQFMPSGRLQDRPLGVGNIKNKGNTMELTDEQRRFLRYHEFLHHIYSRGHTMRTYLCFYKGNKFTVDATSSYQAQTLAAAHFKAKRTWDVTVVVLSAPVDPASI